MEHRKRILWFTTLGWRPNAAINTVWHYCIEHDDFPDILIFIKHDIPRVNIHIDEVKSIFSKLNKVYGKGKNYKIEFVSIEKESIEHYASAANEKIKPYLDDDNTEIFIDITPGRKFMSMILSNIGFKKKGNIKAAYYNHVYSDKFYKFFYPLIPVSQYRVLNMLDYSEFVTRYDNQNEISESENMDTLEKLKIYVKDNKRGTSRSQLRTFLQNLKIPFNEIMFRALLNQLSKSDQIYIDSDSLYHFGISEEKGELKTKKDAVFRLDYLNLITNELALNNYNKLIIESVPLGFPIFEVKISDSIRITPNKRVMSNLKTTNDIPHELKPRNQMWLDLLKMAGIVKPVNMEEIQSNIKELNDYNPLKGELPVLICFDTNLFRNRFYSLLSRSVIQNLGYNRLGFLLSRRVRDELSFDYKYKGAEIEKITDFVEYNCVSKSDTGKKWHKLAADNFFNQNKFMDRLRRIGYQEYIKCKEKEICREISYTSASKLSPDLEIINSVEDFLKNEKIRVLLLSEDRDFIDRAQGISNIIPLLIRYPPVNDISQSFKASWEDFAHLLYSSAVYSGGVIINKELTLNKSDPICVLQGIWAGKESDDWTKNYLKVWGKPEFLRDPLKNLELIS